jgi:hypothetical protein
MMPVSYKVLGQVAGSTGMTTAPTDTLYAVGSGRMAVGSTLTVCNRGTASTKFSIAVSPNGAAQASAHYIYFLVDIAPSETIALTLGWALQAGAVVRVGAISGNVSFTLFGQELTP